jgi:hypothetical protein
MSFDRVRSRFPACVLLGLVLLGCEQTDEIAAVDGDGAAGGGSSACGAPGGATVAIHGSVVEYEYPAVSFPPTDGAEVCVKDCAVPCATTDATGEFYLYGVPADSRVILTFAKSGYVQTATALVTGSEDAKQMSLHVAVSQPAAKALLADAGFDWLFGGSSILYFSAAFPTSPSLPGVVYSIEPAAAKGPVYLGLDGKNDPTLSAATGGPGPARSVGLFQAAAGEYVVRALMPGHACAPSPGSPAGWPGPTPDTIRMPALADTIMSQAWFGCSAP